MAQVSSRTRRVPTQERSRRSVRRILEAAEELVAEAGVDAATTRAIAERAGVAVPSLYRFFADRDEILDALLEQMLEELDAHCLAGEAAWEPGDVDDLLRLEFDLHVGFYGSHPSLAMLWFEGRASVAVVESVRRRNHALAMRVRELLIGHGLVAEDAPAEAFDLLIELGDRVLEVAFRDPRRVDRRAVELGTVALGAFAERFAVI